MHSASSNTEPRDRGAGDVSRKVAFIGSHGVGKTTLCFELAARLKRRDLRVDLVREVARRCPLPLNQQTTLEAQAWILHTQIANEIEALARHDIVVCDRSVLDNYAYMVDRFGRQAAFEPLVARWIHTYDRIVWVPILEGPRYDGIRDTDRTYQMRIETTLAELIERFGVEPLRLHDHDRDTWIELTTASLSLATVQLPLFGEDSA